ncbi:MAG: hypothetical protein RL329_778 [Bacteroidota bacterium]|jgi:hypothetical protein
MKYIQSNWIGIGLLSCLLPSCAEIQTHRNDLHAAASIGAAWEAVGPRAIVYQTQGAMDYDHLVAVTLAEDGSVETFPTLEEAATLATAVPTILEGDFKADNRGNLSGQTAFLNLTYAEYAALKVEPTAELIQSWILTTKPFAQICDCGAKSRFQTKDLNILVKTKLKRCKKLNLKD